MSNRHMITSIHQDGSRVLEEDCDMTTGQATEIAAAIAESIACTVEVVEIRPVLVASVHPTAESIEKHEEREWSEAIQSAKAALATGGYCVRCFGYGRRCNEGVDCGMCGGSGKTKIHV